MCIVLSNVKPVNTLLNQIASMNEEIAQLRSDWEYELMNGGDGMDLLHRLREAEDYQNMLRATRLGLIRARDAARRQS